MYYVYKFLDKEGNVLYVGQTIDIDRRIREHAGKRWDKEKDHVEFAKCNSCVDMCIYEIYYINKLHAKYNEELVYDNPTIELPELEWMIYQKDWLQQQEQERIKEVRKLQDQKFSPVNYWNNKVETLSEKIERLKNENENYKDMDEYKSLTANLNKAQEEAKKNSR